MVNDQVKASIDEALKDLVWYAEEKDGSVSLEIICWLVRLS